MQMDADPRRDQKLLYFEKAGGTSLFRLRVVAHVRGFTWDPHPLNSLTDFLCHISDICVYFYTSFVSVLTVVFGRQFFGFW